MSKNDLVKNDFDLAKNDLVKNDLAENVLKRMFYRETEGSTIQTSIKLV